MKAVTKLVPASIKARLDFGRRS
ncbi:hypothetical protein NSND_62334 [Nitrospira sp. ND1]|nr:hypothetical protein NSND_62334 [Nitrospira sp. ND1]